MTRLDLTEEQRGLLTAAKREPVVRLAERAGRFEEPLGFLKTSMGGFDENRRFLLDLCLQDDPEALRVREDEIAAKLYWNLGQPMRVEDQWYSFDRFLKRHSSDLQQFRQDKYPWMQRQGPLRDTDPRTDRLLDEHVADRLQSYGFSTRTRRNSRWACKSEILGTPLTIHFDKGSYRPAANMTGYIELSKIGYLFGLADVFFFSRSEFWILEGDQLEVQLDRFFAVFERLFADLIHALEDSVHRCEALLEAWR